MKGSPKHYYMAAALITYVRPEGENEVSSPKQRHLNIVMELPRKAITSSGITNANRAAIERFTREANLPGDAVRDFVFLNFSYLGNMAPDDFYDLKPGNLPT